MADEMLRESFAWASGVVQGVKADQLDNPTRCDGWTVRMLLNHMTGAARAFASGVPAGRVEPQVDPIVDIVGDDPAAAYDAACAGAVGTWAAADPDGTTEFPWGPIPNAFARQFLLLESAVHGSDVAAATGQDPTIPEPLAMAASELVTMMLADPANRGVDFKPAIPIGEDVPASDRLVAFLGREP